MKTSTDKKASLVTGNTAFDAEEGKGCGDTLQRRKYLIRSTAYPYARELDSKERNVEPTCELHHKKQVIQMARHRSIRGSKIKARYCRA